MGDRSIYYIADGTTRKKNGTDKVFGISCKIYTMRGEDTIALPYIEIEIDLRVWACQGRASSLSILSIWLVGEKKLKNMSPSSKVKMVPQTPFWPKKMFYAASSVFHTVKVKSSCQLRAVG